MNILYTGKIKTRLLPLLALILLLGACAAGGESTQPGSVSNSFVPALPGNYDSRDSAVLVSKDTAEQKIRFYNLDVGKFYTLSYDGATVWEDKYAQALSLAQVDEGSIVDISFMRERKRLNSLQLSGEAFRFTGQSDLLLSESTRSVFLMGENYTIAPKALVLTPDGPGELMDLNSVDELALSGMGHSVYSITVEKGHGYLKLENASHFVGGFIQIGENRVYQISEDMLLAVPEGSYEITVSNKGSAGTEYLTVRRGEEVSVDASGWVSEPRYGGILFITQPAETQIFIDGEAADISKEVRLSYGIHQMVAKADGYESVSRYIRVSEPLAKLSVTLTQSSASENSASENSTSENSTSANASNTPTPTVSADTVSADSASSNAAESVSPTPTAAEGATPTVSSNGADVSEYRVYIEEPEGVEVYKDGSYLGISPIFFKKAEGTAIITLRKDGCQTRSYTISMDKSAADDHYTFSELVQID